MKILVVDDSAYARKRLALFFEREGHEVIQAEDGQRGLVLFEKESPDLITVDLLMPGMDGLEFIREVRKKDDSIPLVVVSADIQESTKKEVMAAGATGFVGKVEDMGAIMEVLKSTGFRPPELFFTQDKLDALKEHINISLGAAAQALESLLEKPISLKAPEVQVITNTVELEEFLKEQIRQVATCVEQRFTGQINGQAYLAFPKSQASVLVKALLDEEKDVYTLSEAEKTVLSEVGNIVLNSAISGMGNLTKSRLKIGLPFVYFNLDYKEFMNVIVSEIGQRFYILMVISRLTVKDILLTCYLLLGMDGKGLCLLIEALEEAF